MAPGHASIVERLRRHAEERPDARALTFVSPRGGEDRSVTYAELDAWARAIAGALQARTVPGDRAVLLFAPGLEYVAAFFGCLYAGVVAVPAYPPQGHRQLPRLEAIVADAAPRLALTTRETLRRGGGAFEELGASLDYLVVDELEDSDWTPLTPAGSDLAFLQYTSGSTGTPKGAMMRHSNLMHNAEAIYQAFGHGPESVSLLWVPPYHDMGLIGGILQPIYGGFHGVLMSPLSFFMRPMGWLRAIAHYGATTSGGPNFAYELCAQRAKPEDIAALDLSRWTVAFNGAEPVRAETLARFSEVFAPAGFKPEAHFPCYGLAESTLLVSGGRPHVERVDLAANRAAFDEGGVALVASGAPALDHEVRIVAPETHEECGPGTIGEIWVASPSVAGGYWNRPDASEATFAARTSAGEGPYMRTGDLGYMRDGRLFVTGRLKDLIILTGRNHYPQDLEWTVERAHPSLRVGSGAAFTVPAADRPEGEALVLAQEWEGPVPPPEELEKAIGAIRRVVAADHDLEATAVVLLAPGGMPKTSSGKVRRAACRQSFLDGGLQVVASWREAGR